MKRIILLFLLIVNQIIFSQVRQTQNNVWFAKEFSKEIALFRAKSFLYREVLGTDEKINSFEIIPLAASSSGELTTLLYKSSSVGKEGIILGFFGDYITEAGVPYQGYSFKNFNKTQALEFLQKISDAIESYGKYLKDDNDNNNIYFTYEDVDVLIYAGVQNYGIRLFWNGFDSNWDKTAFDRSKKRFEKRMK